MSDAEVITADVHEVVHKSDRKELLRQYEEDSLKKPPSVESYRDVWHYVSPAIGGI